MLKSSIASGASMAEMQNCKNRISRLTQKLNYATVVGQLTAKNDFLQFIMFSLATNRLLNLPKLANFL